MRPRLRACTRQDSPRQTLYNRRHAPVLMPLGTVVAARSVYARSALRTIAVGLAVIGGPRLAPAALFRPRHPDRSDEQDEQQCKDDDKRVHVPLLEDRKQTVNAAPGSNSSRLPVGKPRHRWSRLMHASASVPQSGTMTWRAVAVGGKAVARRVAAACGGLDTWREWLAPQCVSACPWYLVATRKDG